MAGYRHIAEMRDFRLSHHPKHPNAIEVPDFIVARLTTRTVRGGPLECWTLAPQKRSRSPSGKCKVYPEFKWKGDDGRLIVIGAHRLACIMAHGPMPAGTYATHRCANPVCVNPLHLRPGTPSANQRERRQLERIEARSGRKVITLPLRPRTVFACAAIAA